MTIDDRVKKMIQEMLKTEKYHSIGALYNELIGKGAYSYSRRYFSIDFQRAGFRISSPVRKKETTMDKTGYTCPERKEEEKDLSVKKAAVRRGASLAVGRRDIAYFIEVAEDIVFQNIRRYGKGSRKKFEAGRIWSKRHVEHISYRRASKMYELLARECTPEEIQRETYLSPLAYAFLLENKARIEPTIITALQTLYENQTHNVPYVTEELRNGLRGK